MRSCDEKMGGANPSRIWAVNPVEPQPCAAGSELMHRLQTKTKWPISILIERAMLGNMGSEREKKGFGGEGAAW